MAYVPPNIQTYHTHFIQYGRRVQLRGIDMMFGQGDSAAVRLGARFVRIWVPWSLVEPTRGRFDGALLSKLDTQVKEMRRDHINVLLDFHQTGKRPPPAWSGYRTHACWFCWSGSRALYWPFVQMMVLRYQKYANVMGFEVWNEPHPIPETAAGTNAIIQWDRWFVLHIRQLDRGRAVVVQLRSGWDYGMPDVKLTPLQLPHVALDFHDNWAGTESGTGFGADGNAIASDCKATDACSAPYHGTLASQERHLQYAMQWVRRVGRPLLIGEWDGPTTDPRILVLQAQVVAAMAADGLSWARWQGSDAQQLFAPGGGLTPAGEQMKSFM